MYVPKYYQMKDYTKIKDFMMHNNFVTIITYDELKPLATHLPVNIEEKDNTLYVSGHFAKANKQWKTIVSNEHILIIFHGPHAYISSTWYEKEDVPTWDYQSIHAYGKGHLLSESELIDDLTILLNKYESHRHNGATWNNLSDQTKKQVKGIVGFKMEIEEIDAAYKLSQNRSDIDKKNIVSELNKSVNPVDTVLAKEIEDNK
ncbi:FMN-binding negative transcriptional regulator [Mammaliicoccus sciuri]|uniref:FMN-binding negative transcriptional regulator n=1 Tax=Mammaliicoccus sciuri TaxID=1296 RepID=UPI002B25B0D9|nr:FMN-binding negative transcriptional regulator [Mammaliicoccus sciuri]WQK71127.1 FMN-binding negative transcriptional regulator [Mammaliicoccus sciuri]